MTEPGAPDQFPAMVRGAMDALQQRAERAEAEVERLRLCANSARFCLERHRATRGSNDLLDTALRELDDACPPYVEVEAPPNAP